MRLLSHPKPKNSRLKSGFTLTELLVAVAILAVLAVSAAASVPALKSRLLMRQLDVTAREIFVVAQNKATALKASGTLSDLGGSPMTQMPADFDTENWDWAALKGDYYYLTSETASPLISEATEGALIDEGYYIIEYNAKTGSIYGVFYALEPMTYASDIQTMTSRSFDERKGLYIGYYGGAITEANDIEQIPAPQIALINGERLYLEIAADFRYAYTVTIGSDTGMHTYTLENLASPDVLLNENVSATADSFTVVLDSLEQGLGFHDLFASKGFVPGQDITVTVTASRSGALSASSTASANSLFARRQGDRADIACFRHLQNLAPDVSGLPVTGDWHVSHAVQTVPIAMPEGTERFYPITNTALTSFDGQGNTISGLKIRPTESGQAGLFGTFGTESGSCSLTGIRLVNPAVDGGSAQQVGALAGLTRNAAVTDCRVYADPDSLTNLADCYVKASGSEGLSLGGLIGRAAGGSIERSFASLPLIDAACSGSAPAYIGGFLGQSAAVISNCYANTGTLAIRSERQGVAFAGGFIGLSDADIRNAYATGTLEPDESAQIGGFAGVLAGAEHANVDLYAAMGYANPAGGAQIRGFVFSVIGAPTLSNCLCMSGSGFTETGAQGAGIAAPRQIRNAFSAGAWSKSTSATTMPYLLTGAYPLPRLAVMAHYGDWPRISELDPVQLAYYEIYRLTNGSYSIGFYNDTFPDGQAEGLNTLLNPSAYADIVQDGYVLLFEKDWQSAAVQGIAYDQLTNPAYVYLRSGQAADSPANPLKRPSAFRINGSSVTVRYGDSALSDGDAITIDAAAYYPLFIPLSQLQADDDSRFYQTLTVGLNPRGTGVSAESERTYYFNPSFAKSLISTEIISETAVTVSIRTERQYAALADSSHSQYWSSHITYVQERALNFSSNLYTTTYFDTPVPTGWVDTDPIGNSVSPFQGTYDGKGYAITGLNIAMPPSSSLGGMFGYARNATLKNIHLENPSVNYYGNFGYYGYYGHYDYYGNSGVSSLGALAGRAEDAVISSVTVANPRVYGNHLAGAVAGEISGGSTVRDVTITGGWVAAARLAGTFGRLTGNAAGEVMSVTDVQISGLNLTTYINESGAYSGSAYAANGAGAFAGNIYLGAADAAITISNIALSGCTVYSDENAVPSDDEIDVSALFTGTVYSASSPARLSFGSGISIADSTLFASSSRLSGTYGAMFGAVSASTSWSMTAPAVSLTNTVISRANATRASNTTIGGYVGALQRDAGTLTVNLGAQLNLTGLFYSWNSHVYGNTMGGFAGRILSSVTVSAPSGGTRLLLNGSAAPLLCDGGATGGFAGFCSGTVTGISVLNPAVYTGNNYYQASNAGGFAGRIMGGRVSNCDVRLTGGFDTNIISVFGNAGGFAGILSTGAVVENCFAAIDTVHSYYHEGSYAGGFAAVIDNSRVLSCYASGDVKGYEGAGGFAGLINNTGSNDIRWCYSAGDVDGMSYYAWVGGFVGEYRGGSIRYCYSLGKVINGLNSWPGSGVTSGGFAGFLNAPAPVTAIKDSAYLFYPGKRAYNSSYTDFAASAGIIRWTPDVFYAEALTPGMFTQMSPATASFPYASGLNHFPYPALSAVGTGITGAVHWGNWPLIDIAPVPSSQAGLLTMGVFRYELIDGSIYRITVSAVRFGFAGNGDIINLVTYQNFYTEDRDLTFYLQSNTLTSPLSGYGIFWNKGADTADFQLNGRGLSAYTLNPDLGISADYVFHPVASLSPETGFYFIHDNGKSSKNVDADYQWVGSDFILEARIR